ncbi:cytochrome P450 [Lactarius indigo]|nr:cytochrome P450 [Lactarius indigo]
MISISDRPIVAVAAYPDITMMIQEELDDVVGRGRLPTFDDEGSLPYLVAWRPVVPFAIPHATSKGDVYAGYDIPASTTCTRQASLFENPETFNPSQVLKLHNPVGSKWNGKVEGEFTMPFGFGRRVFPDIHIELQSTFHSIARILWEFDVRHAIDGSCADPRKIANLGLTRMPAPFHISVSVQLADALHLIRNESRNAELRLREWEY